MKDKSEFKILLIQPPITVYGEVVTGSSVSFPINLLYLLSYLKKHGYTNVKIKDFLYSPEKQFKNQEGDSARVGWTDQEIKEQLESEKPDLVGISCVFTRYFNDSHNLAKLVKETSPNAKVVFGGTHATNFATETLKDANVDFVVRGEGELTFLQLAETLSSGGDAHAGKGLSYRRSDGTIQHNDKQPPLDINTLPALDYEAIDMDIYIDRKGDYQMKYPSFQFSTSRGCPMNCIYCSVNTVWERKWRGREPKLVLDEIEYLYKKYGLKEIAFLDDSISVDPKRFMAICQGLIDRKIKIHWSTPNGIAHWTLNKEIIALMKKAGCYRLTFGIESGNKQIRGFLGKPFDLNQAKELIQYANSIGMWTIITNILGFPDEDQDKVDDTLNFAITSGADFAAFFRLTPYPDAPIYKVLKEKGLLDFEALIDPLNDNSKLISDYLSADLRTHHMSSTDINNSVHRLTQTFFKHRMKSYLKNPLKIFKKIYSWDSFVYTLKIFWAFSKMILRAIKHRRFDITMLYKGPKKKKEINN